MRSYHAEWWECILLFFCYLIIASAEKEKGTSSLVLASNHFEVLNGHAKWPTDSFAKAVHQASVRLGLENAKRQIVLMAMANERAMQVMLHVQHFK